jgi:hypothetical protein
MHLSQSLVVMDVHAVRGGREVWMVAVAIIVPYT